MTHRCNFSGETTTRVMVCVTSPYRLASELPGGHHQQASLARTVLSLVALCLPCMGAPPSPPAPRLARVPACHY